MQCHDDGWLFHIWIILNGYHRTTTSSTIHSLEVCKSLEEIYITFRLSWRCTLGWKWLRPQRWTACCMLSSPNAQVKAKVYTTGRDICRVRYLERLVSSDSSVTVRRRRLTSGESSDVCLRIATKHQTARSMTVPVQYAAKKVSYICSGDWKKTSSL